MTESADADAAAARASEQARLRKERREAKIKAGGSARLNRITGLGGGFQRDPIPTATASGTDAATTTASPTPAAAPTSDHADPDEVDISSQHFPSPRRQQQQQQQPPSEMSEAQLRQLMLGMDMPRGDGSAPANPFAGNPFLNPGLGGPGGQPGGPEDPMMKMLQQMMGGQMPGGGAGGFPGMPGAAPQQQQQQQAPLDTYSAAWRILHLVVALGLGLYIALTGAFMGTLEARDAARLASDAGMSSADLDESNNNRARFFYMFATAEAVLLTSRFFLDRSRAPPPGILWTVAGFLPPSMKRYLETALRYGQVFTTVRSDLLVCVFVLGVCHWWRTIGVVGV
ncbi:hypothetical protein MCOR27_002680 [Pyricularia oryzae]|uniref:GET complex subunit GET2 n=2 Tax=Pyricularia TaxID=48558 RepID=A0ABQ8NXW8_PYRGI|nr:hypothetical protein MCOR02_006481 [Pyricularia oryzae]KAI6302346.1 hypothetical protein MCOR33_002246 [Pyricularia grisea]KAI6260477.1 hypothetical protein MCOR19_003270 [Pyricularia oryzae]KAI6282093.1 hypothetical protein MCOR26_003037 [Pyricularia oryzae]KAI6284550.1 hypothetical protein MCOR27_002680 [Pyricularia oryzae]